MTRGLAAAVTILLLSTGHVLATPFDQFQVIMWQDHGSVETAGLFRLGFTATRLIGNGGLIDPAKLAVARASGRPWYVENIATDFFAPYHRYTPDKPVTWMFDAAKARLRADSGDTGVFVRDPGLSDPVWLTSVARRLDAVVRGQSQYRPLFYNMADEAGIGDLAAAWDADIAPASLAAMRTWLRGQYSDLAALNRQWGSEFGDWDAVVPELTSAAMRRTDDNYSAWADFKAWMDVAFAGAVASGSAAVHGADPAALAGLEGGQTPGWGGYDYSLLAPAVDVMEIYDSGNAVELARAFNPRLVLLRTSFGSGPREVHAAWRHLLLGGRGMIVWDEQGDVVRADGEPGPRGEAIAATVAAMRVVAPALMASEPALDPVAVLYSQASFRTRWMLDQRVRGAAWADRDAAREYEDNAWRASRRQVLRRLREIGVQPSLLSSAMVEAGALRHDGPRVLILPHAIALSPDEAEEIRAFRQRGGTVLADTEPGIFDQHSRRMPSPMLAGVAELSEAMTLDEGGSSANALGAFSALLRRAGVIPRAELLGPDGLPATGVAAEWRHHGDTLILGLQTETPWGAAGRIEVRLTAPAVIQALGPNQSALSEGPPESFATEEAQQHEKAARCHEDQRHCHPPDAPRLILGRELQAGRFAVTLDPIVPTILSLRR